MKPSDSNFHVYGVDRESDMITFFFDGRQVQLFAQLAPPAVPALGATDQTEVSRLNWLELSTEVQTGYGILDGSTNFQVDYVRAWTIPTVGQAPRLPRLSASSRGRRGARPTNQSISNHVRSGVPREQCRFAAAAAQG